MQKKIIHIDMDCFYAAIEMRDNPSLAEVPMAVGGSADKRGVLCTSNYLARQFGVRSAMPTAKAKQLCPDLVVIRPNMAKYRFVSERLHKVFAAFTDLIEPLSLDEAYLDVTECQQCNGVATEIAQLIRHRIFQQEKITASAGIGPNKFLAKVASDWRKPNGQFAIKPHQVDQFMLTLPVEKIFGVGKVTAQKLKAQNLFTCADLQKLTLPELQSQFGRFGERLFYLCRGVDDRAVECSRERKSLSVETTYPTDLPDSSSCLAELDSLFLELKNRLNNIETKRLHKQFVKIKYNNFQQTTVEKVSERLSETTYRELLKKGLARQQRPVRLLGLGVGFESAQQGNEGPLQLQMVE